MRLLAIVLSLLVVFAPASVAAASTDDPYAPLQWGLTAIEAPRAWRASTGSGAVVAVIDSGVDASHPDLKDRVLPGRDFVDGDDDASDENGHGTLVAGIIAAATGNGIGGASVAPDARILPVRVLDADGIGKASDVAAGIRWASARGVDVINLSLAQDTSGGGLGNLLADRGVDRAIRQAAEAGATVVIAAGNSSDGGRDRTAYDATVAGAIVVGATTRNDRLAAYSNHGEGLDLVAPGGGTARNPDPDVCSERNGIVGAWWNPETRGSSYGAGCGTSMAVAFVSGVAALLHATGASNGEAAARIVATADRLAADPRTGAGRVNAARALGVPEAPQPPRSTASPSRSPAPSARVDAAGSTAPAAGMAHEPDVRVSSRQYVADPPSVGRTIALARTREEAPRGVPTGAAAALLLLVLAAHAARVVASQRSRRASFADLEALRRR